MCPVGAPANRGAFLAGAAASMLSGCATPYRPAARAQVDERALRAAGGVLCFPVHVDRFDAALRRQIGAIAPAAFVVFASTAGGKAAVRDTVAALRRLGAPGGVIVATDEEGGLVQRIPVAHRLPSAMAVCATGSRELAYRFGAGIGSLCLDAGIDTVLGPVLDLAAVGSVLGTRSFSDDAARVARTATDVVRGIRASGARGVLKHYPGYAFGDEDPEAAVTVDRRPVDALLRSTAAFPAAYRRGDAVMTSHTIVPALDGQRPGTLSPAVVAELRTRMPGALVVSDALDMPALTSRYPAADIPAAALGAGVDCLLYSHESAAVAAAYALADAIANGGIAPQRLAGASGAVQRFVRAASPATRSLHDVSAVQREIAAASITAVDEQPTAQPAITLVAPFAHGARLAALVAAPLSAHAGVTFRADDTAPYDANRLHLVLLDTRAQASLVRAAFERIPVARRAVACLGDPYAAAPLRGLPAYFTYGAEFDQLDALARIVAGGARPRGTLPVRLG